MLSKMWLNKRPCKMVKSAQGFPGRIAWAQAWWQKCAFYVLGFRYRGNGHEMSRERIRNRGQGDCTRCCPAVIPIWFEQLMQYQDLRCHLLPKHRPIALWAWVLLVSSKAHFLPFFFDFTSGLLDRSHRFSFIAQRMGNGDD